MTGAGRCRLPRIPPFSTKRSAPSRLAQVFVLVAALAAGCGDGTPPTGPPSNPAPPQLTCAAPVIVDGAIGASQPVTYPTPTVSNGSVPVNVTCAPASGSMFSIGETIVTCTAVDAIARQATCTFGVTLRHRQLALTNYLAYGDSMTEGENGH